MSLPTVKPPIPPRVIRRILSNITFKANGCWEWNGNVTSRGYVEMVWSTNGKKWRVAAHRAIYEALVGPIPEAKQIDHLCHDPDTCPAPTAIECRHRRCMNPEHLGPASPRQNILRGGNPTAINSRAKKCVAGHQFDEANTYIAKGRRQCRECKRIRRRAWRAAHVDEYRAQQADYYRRRIARTQ